MRGNACVRFYKDQHDIWYSKVAEMFALCHDRTKPMTTNNTLLFTTLPPNSELFLEAVPSPLVPDEERLRHFDYWGVIPIGVNPMQTATTKKKRTTKVVTEVDEDIVSDSELKRREIVMDYFIKHNYGTLNKTPLPPMPPEVSELIARNKVLNPSSSTIQKSIVVEDTYNNVKEQIEMLTNELNTFNSALLALQNAIPALLEASTAIAKAPIPEEPIVNYIDTPEESLNVSADVVNEDLDTFVYPELRDPIPEIYYIDETTARATIAEGVLRLSTLLVSIKPYIPKQLGADARFPNEIYLDSRVPLSTVIDTLLVLSSILEEKSPSPPYSKSYADRVSAYARNVSNVLSFQLESLPRNAVLSTFGVAYQADVIAVTKALQAGLVSWRKLAKLL